MTCLLAALGYEHSESDTQEARAHAGALLIAEGLHDLRIIRKALTTSK